MNGLRPTFVECNGCTNFLMEGVTAKGSPYWCIHPLYSKNVIIRNMNVDTSATSANGDGTDADSCDTCLIENMTYNTSDDMVAIKSGLNEVGIAVNRPSHNVVVRNIKATDGPRYLDWQRDVRRHQQRRRDLRHDRTITGVQYLLRIKTLAGRGGVVQNVFFEDVDGTGLRSAILLTTNYASSTITPKDRSLIPVIKNVTVKNVTGVGGVSLTGLPSAKLQNIAFDADVITGMSNCTLVTGLDIVSSSIGLTGTSCN